VRLLLRFDLRRFLELRRRVVRFFRAIKEYCGNLYIGPTANIRIGSIPARTTYRQPTLR
jgi:hypothetical protein